MHQSAQQSEACSDRYLKLCQSCLQKTWATESPNIIASECVGPDYAWFVAIQGHERTIYRCVGMGRNYQVTSRRSGFGVFDVSIRALYAWRNAAEDSSSKAK